MKFFTNPFFFLGLLLIGGLAACGGKSDCTIIDNENGTATFVCDDGSHFLIENGQNGSSSVVQCTADADCAEGCAGYDAYICSTEGRCYCNDIQEDRGCDLDTDCAEGCTGHDTHTCSGGTCFCSDEMVSALEVSLSANQMPSSTLPKGATHVWLASFDFTAVSHVVVPNNLTIHRGGVGQTSDWDSLYLQNDEGRSMSSRFSIDQATDSTTFPFGSAVWPGFPKTIHLYGDVSVTAGDSNQHYFYIASKASVLSIGNIVTGDFPVAGNTFTIGGVAVNTVTVAQGSVSPNPRVGQVDAEVGSFTLTAGSSSDLALRKIELWQLGSLDILVDLDVNTIRLYRGTDPIASGIDQVVVRENSVEFNLLTPYYFPANNAKVFYVKADIIGGLPGDTINFSLLDYFPSSIVVIDQQYGFGAQLVNNFGETEAQTLTLQ